MALLLSLSRHQPLQDRSLILCLLSPSPRLIPARLLEPSLYQWFQAGAHRLLLSRHRPTLPQAPSSLSLAENQYQRLKQSRSLQAPTELSLLWSKRQLRVQRLALLAPSRQSHVDTPDLFEPQSLYRQDQMALPPSLSRHLKPLLLFLPALPSPSPSPRLLRATMDLWFKL
ncbi:hypothetical protein B0I35DRAFT_433751 [Stachybotrys elegans]|uniref:Uncharacterized protein n=1 Tax=Stachybotrys elegans TaxID=80388 RepID=A0A8K0WQC5_9HYPO|nr:hypothetical protein B0I35DRAFT_433751 [Stachybotrys elegans]